jgi:hypothetical protein
MELANSSDFYSNLISRVNDAQLRAATKASLNARDMIKRRVITSGENASGKKFKKYSQAQIPIQKLASRSGGQSKANALIKKGKFTASYEEWRVINNLQVNHRDFRFTGTMWNSIKPILVKNNNSIIQIDINSDNLDERKKIQDNTNRSGNFLLPNAGELQNIIRYYNTEFGNELSKILK